MAKLAFRIDLLGPLFTHAVISKVIGFSQYAKQNSNYQEFKVTHVTVSEDAQKAQIVAENN